MTAPPNSWPRFSVQTWRDGISRPGTRLVLCRVVGRGAGYMVRRHTNGSTVIGTMIGSPGVAEANPGPGGDGWGPWEPWDPDGLVNEAERRRLHALVSEPATRADLEAAEPLDLLLLLAALWHAILMGADEPVVAPWIDGLALATIHAAGTRPVWLDEGAALDELHRPLRAALVKLGEALGVGELEHNAGAWVERGWTAEDGAWWLSSRADAWIRARWGDEAAPAAPARADWAAFNAGKASAWSLVRIWIDPEREGPIPSPLVAWLAGELWAREVLPRLEREREELETALPLVWQPNEDFLRRKHPSLLLAAGTPLVRSLVRARPMDGGLLVDADNRQIPLALRSTVEGLIVGDLAALGTAAAQRLVRMVVEAGAVAAYGDGRRVLYSTDPRVEVYRDRATGDAVLTCWGGWPALGRLCGLEGNKGREQVKDAAYALAAVSLRWKGPKGGGADALLGVRDGDADGEYRAAPGREARVVLRISPPLAPGLVHSMPKGRRALAPVLRDPPSLPRTLDRHAAAIGRADFLAMFEARALAVDLYSKDRMALPWDRVFEEAAVPRQARAPALEALGSPEARRWVRLSETFWTLAETGPTGDALAWLKEAGRQEASGSRAGKAGAATRQGRAKRRKP